MKKFCDEFSIRETLSRHLNEYSSQQHYYINTKAVGTMNF